MAAALFRASRVAAARVSARRAPLAVAKAAATATPRLLTVSAASRAEDDSHDDFKPVSKVDASNVSETISKIVTENPIVLFMKGTPQQPMCGFSNRVVMIMNMHGLPYHAVNVLADPAIREGIKAFSDWPTIPQLYVKGEFVGGCDIVSDMHEDGSLADTLKAAE